jgi:RNA-directed DNA polymerase
MYPSLVEAVAPPKLKAPFYKYAEMRTGEVTELTGGVGGICKLLKYYHVDVQHRFKAPAPRFPVIVLIDNDKGVHSVYEAIAGITKKKKPQGLADLIPVTGNLSVLPTPRGPNNGETAIEDFFNEATLKEELDGRKFDRCLDPWIARTMFSRPPCGQPTKSLCVPSSHEKCIQAVLIDIASHA